jgi:hypothetical protein
MSMRIPRPPQQSDRGLHSIMVAFWCSAMAITATAAPGPEPLPGTMSAPQLVRHIGLVLAEADATPAAGERAKGSAPATTDEARPKAAETEPGRRRSARQSDPDHDSFRTRAQQLLAAEGASRATYSKLAEKYPEHSIVICQAGCRDRTPEIVYFAPRKVQVAEMIPAAATAGPAPESKTVSDAMTCLAGCYDTPRQYPSQRRGETARLSEDAVERYVHQQGTTPANGVVVSGRWLTTVTEAERKPKRGREIESTTSGQWMRKIETQRRARIRKAY